VKKKIAEWLRKAADKLTGEQTIDIAIAKEIVFRNIASNHFGNLKKEVENFNRNQVLKENEWVRSSIIEGVRKASFEGILRWEENITEKGATIGARLRIISPIIIKRKENEKL